MRLCVPFIIEKKVVVCGEGKVGNFQLIDSLCVGYSFVLQSY